MAPKTKNAGVKKTKAKKQKDPNAPKVRRGFDELFYVLVCVEIQGGNRVSMETCIAPVSLLTFIRP